jgi:hypothetical protein
MGPTKKTLSAEKFSEIYKSEKFRNEVSSAHQCCDQYSNFKHFATCSYPVSYIVTPEQRHVASKERQKAKEILLKRVNSKEYDNVLLFVGMGMSYNPETYKGNTPTHTENMKNSDIRNHRIRTEFTVNGGNYFVEFGTDRIGCLHCDFSIDRDHKDAVNEYFYNYGGIERTKSGILFTKENILNLVNRTFNSNFKTLIVDEYNLKTGNYKSRSTK